LPFFLLEASSEQSPYLNIISDEDVITFATAPDYPPRFNAHRGSVAASVELVLAIFYCLILLMKAHLWAGRGGPVQRLATHARGRAYGFLAAVLCQLGIIMALLFAK